jgi:hypothetical protein
LLTPYINFDTIDCIQYIITVKIVILFIEYYAVFFDIVCGEYLILLLPNLLHTKLF